jgi:hypothetical protein
VIYSFHGCALIQLVVFINCVCNHYISKHSWCYIAFLNVRQTLHTSSILPKENRHHRRHECVHNSQNKSFSQLISPSKIIPIIYEVITKIIYINTTMPKLLMSWQIWTSPKTKTSKDLMFLFYGCKLHIFVNQHVDESIFTFI